LVLRGDVNPLLRGYSTFLFYHLDYLLNTSNNSSMGVYAEIKHLIEIYHPEDYRQHLRVMKVLVMVTKRY